MINMYEYILFKTKKIIYICVQRVRAFVFVEFMINMYEYILFKPIRYIYTYIIQGVRGGVGVGLSL